MSVKLESSLTDLMTSLAVIFILLMVANINNVGQSGKSEIIEIHKQLDQKGIDCVIREDDPLACTITISNNDLLFGFKESAISSKGQAYLNDRFPQIMETLMDKSLQEKINGVFIEGYTDQTGDPNENLKLSQDRSFAVGYFVLNNVFANNQEYREHLLKWLYLNGRGEQNQKSTDEESRRVELTIRVKSFSQITKQEIQSATNPSP